MILVFISGEDLATNPAVCHDKIEIGSLLLAQARPHNVLHFLVV